MKQMIEHVVMMKMHEAHLNESENLKSALQAQIKKYVIKTAVVDFYKSDSV